ncbi:histone-lysine n-methyltransferase atxr3 [Hordeum vulgare]|nr:histone-lysine n-methyltransferase atxr3 [Hordeum vulgare]
MSATSSNSPTLQVVRTARGARALSIARPLPRRPSRAAAGKFVASPRRRRCLRPHPQPMSAAEQEDLTSQVMEESVRTHDERQCEGLEEMLALLAVGNVAFPELDAYMKEDTTEEAQREVAMEEPAGWNPVLVGQSWTWTETVPCMPEVYAGRWSPSRSREEVVQAPPQPAQQVALPAHLWQRPPYVDLTGDEDDDKE